MCGIVGAVAERNIVPDLLEALGRIEYRGYDSAGVAVLDGATRGAPGSALRRVRAAGRVSRLARLALERGLAGTTAIAHTHWAIRLPPSAAGAHPLVSDGVSVVLHGSLENCTALRTEIEARGYRFDAGNEIEVVAHLVRWQLASGLALFEAVRASVRRLRGAYAMAVIERDHPDRMVLACNGAPLLVGLGEGENFAASDATAIAGLARRVVHLEEGDCAEIGPDWLRIVDATEHCANRPVRRVYGMARSAIQLAPQHRHFMQREIMEQPDSLARTLQEVCAEGGFAPDLFGNEAGPMLARAAGLQIIACGTSFHAGLVARYWIEALAGIPCRVELASEYRNRMPVQLPGMLVVAISQSGETADTLAALRHARSLGNADAIAICNASDSTLTRSCQAGFATRAGPEIAVASTKTFTAQLAALAVLAFTLARLRGRVSSAEESSAIQAMKRLPEDVAQVLELESRIRVWAAEFGTRRHALFLGRGVHYPIAMEGALKLKEVSYLHAEAYAAGELKHGPLALVDHNMPVVAVAPNDALSEKLKSNLQEVRARAGELYVLADRESALAEGEGVHLVRLPWSGGLLSPIVHAVPLQWLAYHTALARGVDPDKPRNLAKSVMVE